jgi:Tfp pilus assembly protein FimT
VKQNLAIVAILLVIAVTIAAAVYRVTTAPDRIRMRLNAARDTCLNTGGRWVKVGNEESCLQPATAQEKV